MDDINRISNEDLQYVAELLGASLKKNWNGTRALKFEDGKEIVMALVKLALRVKELEQKVAYTAMVTGQVAAKVGTS